MTKSDFSELLALGTGAPLDYNQDETFIDAFLRQVHVKPNSIAVLDEYGSFTYDELDRRSDFIAARLLQMGVQVGDFIAVKLPRIKEFLVSIIGIWKVGAAYLPLDPSYPEKRLNYMLEDSGAKIVIDSSWLELFQKDCVSVSRINRSLVDSVAIVFYTSGSTGSPKGVLNTHRSVRALCYDVNTMYLYENNDVVAHVSSFNYVMSCVDLFPPLLYGLSVYILNQSLLFNLESLDRCIRDNHISIISVIPQIGIPLVKTFHTPLKTIVMGGSKVETLNDSGIRIISAYGLTEVCPVAFITSNCDSKTSRPLLGRPCPGVTIMLEDESGNPIPRGELGEICISSPLVAAGYLHRDDLTLEKFVSRPWSRSKVFRSGDFARWTENGILEFHGRVDDMVKVRGNRVELGEVESAMMKIQGVQESAVAVRELHLESVLCGYYVSTLSITPETMRVAMSEFLPDYMIPSMFVRLDELPKLPNGKLDRKSLPLPDIAIMENESPRSDFEKSVCSVVKREMGNDNLGVTTNLISVGLTSLRAIKLSAVLKTELDITIPGSIILSNPVIREWEGILHRKTVTIPVETMRKYYPLTDNQMGMYIDWEQNHSTDQYNLPFIVKIEGGDARKLYNALLNTIKLYPILKMQLAQWNGAVFQVRRDNAELVVEYKQIDSEPDELYFRKLVRPFNLFGDDLARFTVFSSPKAAWLFFDIHHIIFDGGSLNLFLKAVASAYRGIPSEAECVTAYDYSLFKEMWKNSEQKKEYECYFDALIKDTRPSYYPSSKNSTTNGKLGCLTINIPRDRIKKFCSYNEITENTFFATVLTQVLHRASRDKDIQITMISSGRSMVQLSNSIGCFVQSLPLVSRTVKGTIGNALNEMHKQIVETLSRDQYPYQLLVEKYGIKPNVMFVYQGDVVDDFDFGPVPISLYRVPVNYTINPLSVEILPGVNEYNIKFEYDCGMYDKKDIEILSRTISALAYTMSGSTYDTSLTSLSIVSEDEKQSLVLLGTGDKSDYNRNETFIDLFLQRVIEYSDSVAVVDYRSRLTYKELDERSNVLAEKLITCGISVNDFVAVKLPRVKEFIVAVLGIWKAGAAYVPIDSEYPDDRINFIINDSNAKIVVDEEFLLSTDFNKKTEPVNLSAPENLSYMIYTSGSSGKPKGVMIQHRALRCFSHFIVNKFRLTSASRISCHSSFSFDASVDIFPVLTVGGTQFILSEEIRMNLDLLSEYIIKNGIVGGDYSTQIGQMLATSYPDLPLDYISVGGEKMNVASKCKYRLINVYGPTEMTVDCTFIELDNDKDYQDIPIGRPLDNLYAFVCDEYGNLLPRGMCGELCMAGPQLSKGYWNRPELTEKAFVDCPYLENQKMYRTGDLVRWNEDGNLEFRGRIDNQIKLRGYRIELGEIESIASRIDGVTSAVALVNGETLCLYYTGEITEKTVKLKLAENLPEYMVPQVYVHLKTIPRNSSDKVDRRALPVPKIQVKEIVPPKTEFEKQIFSIVSSELQTQEFGVTTNLISIGLNSIKAIKLSIEIKKKTNCFIKTGDILSKPYIREWIKLVNKESEIIDVLPRQETYPLTPNQLGIYIDCEQNKNGLQYNIPVVLKFSNIIPEKLLDSLQQIIDLHPYFKLRIQVDENGNVVQQRRENEHFPLLFKALDTEPTKDFFQSKIRPFDLLNENLARFEIYYTNETTYLFYDIHHIIFDGASDRIFISELFKAYNGIELKKENVSAFDYSLFHEKWEKSENYSKSDKYFEELIHDTEPFMYPSVSSDEYVKDKSETYIGHILREDIKEYCSNLGITENIFWAVVLTQVFHRISRKDNIQISTISNGRSLQQLSNTIGMFVQTLPLVSRSSKGKVSDILLSMQEQIISTIRNDQYPFVELVEKYNVKPNVLYAYQGDVDENNTFKNLEQIPLELDIVKMPLSIGISNTSEEYNLFFEYDKGLYTEEEIKRLYLSVSNFASNLIKQSEESNIEEISLVSDDERRKIIALGTGEKIDYDRTKTFVDLFIKQVNEYPTTIAVDAVDGQLTYATLDEKSNIFASELIKLGVKANEFVIVKLPRIKEFATSVIGIWKAGAAYVPIDPEFPAERINSMIEDSTAKVVIDEEFLSKIDFSRITDPINLTTPDSISYMIYTSGSTGKPKGVTIKQCALSAFIAWRGPFNGTQPGDHEGANANFCFDASMDIWVALANGITLHIIPNEIRNDLSTLYNYIVQNNIKVMGLNTSLGVALLDNYDTPLNLLCLGGEKMTPFRACNTRVANAYGPTEFTVASVIGIIDQTFPYDTDIPIGRPVPNSISVIVDKNNNILPRGFIGELCSVGDQIGEGYWNNLELTQEKFIDCPFIRGNKMYKTGDLAYWNEKGELMFLGRIDNQIKLRGYRIELGEIETCMRAYPGIVQAAVDIKKIGTTEFLCGYYVSENPIDEKALKSSLEEVLTQYMVPTYYIRMETIPRTTSDKIDRRTLPVPKIQVNEIVLPENSLESEAYKIATEVIGHSNFGVTDTLSEIGFNSLDLMKLSVRLSRELSITCRLSDLIHYKSLRKILQGLKRICWLHSPFVSTKPVIALIWGIIPATDMDWIVEIMDRYFNVCIIEPLISHYDLLFKGETFDNVVDFYTLQLSLILPQDVDIHCFVGYSFAGDLALAMADLQQKITGNKAVVILGDSYLNKKAQLLEGEEELMLMKEVYKIKNDNYTDFDKWATVFRKNCKIVIELQETENIKQYFGKVIYLNALKGYDNSTDINEKLTLLNRYANNPIVCDFPDVLHHYLFTNKEIMGPFYEKLFAEISKSW